jgi:lipoteichoic acid synthase
VKKIFWKSGARRRNPAYYGRGPGVRPYSKALRAFMLYAYIPLAIAYMEILLRLLCGYPFTQGLAFALFFSLCAGLCVSLISLVFASPRASRAIAGALLGVFSLLFVLEHFIFVTYNCFMSFKTIISEAANVLTEFSGVLISIIISGLPVICGFFLPLLIFLLLTGKLILYSAGDKSARFQCACLLALLLGFSIAGQTVILLNSAGDRAACHAEYNFDVSSRRLGLLSGLGLDLRYDIFGNPYADAAFSPQDLPREAPHLARPAPAAAGGEPALPAVPEEAAPPEYGYNMLDIDFAALSAGEDNAKIKAIGEYVANLPASRQNEYTGLFAGKNLIIITAEAFSKEVVDAAMTPALYRLVHNGFYFADFYQPAWGGSTSGGEFAILAGLAPVAGAQSMQKTVGQNLCYTIGNKLQNRAYFSAAYHNGTRTYYSRHKTHPGLGYATFTAMGNGMEEYVGSVWPASDLEMMQYSLPQYIGEQPFSVYYMSISGHCMYSKGGNSMSDKNWDAYPQYEEMSSAIRAYMACNLELEYALRFLLSALESAGIADDTVIVMAADHYPYGLKKSASWGTEKDYLNELYGFNVNSDAGQDHSALIIWCGSLENEQKKFAAEISTPVYSLDILPTLCNLFGVEYDSRLLPGRDVFSEAPPLVFWPNRSWKTELGYYDANKGAFIPAPQAVIPGDDDYVNVVKTTVKNKITYSDTVIRYDYFNILFNPDGSLRF